MDYAVAYRLCDSVQEKIWKAKIYFKLVLLLNKHLFYLWQGYSKIDFSYLIVLWKLFHKEDVLLHLSVLSL